MSVSRRQSLSAADDETSVSVLCDKVGELKLDNDRLNIEVTRLTGELDSMSTAVSAEAWASRRREDLLDREVSRRPSYINSRFCRIFSHRYLSLMFIQFTVQ